MTPTQIKSKIQREMKEAIEYLRVEYENERHGNEKKITPFKIGKLNIKIKVIRSNIESNNRMLITPKLAKRLEFSISIEGKQRYSIMLSQEDKAKLVVRDYYWAELPAILIPVSKAIAKVMSEALDRQIELTDGDTIL